MTEDEIVSITDPKDTNLCKLWKIFKDRGVWVLQFMGSQRVGHNLAMNNCNKKYTIY